MPKIFTNWAIFGRLMVCRKIANFQDLKAIAIASVDSISKFNMPRVGKRKGYPKKNSEKFFFAPHKFFSNFRKKNFFSKTKKKDFFHLIRNRQKKKLFNYLRYQFSRYSNQQGGIFRVTDGDTHIFAEQPPPWHKITPLRSARFSTLRE